MQASAKLYAVQRINGEYHFLTLDGYREYVVVEAEVPRILKLLKFYGYKAL